MRPPSDDCSSYLVMVGSVGAPLVDQGNNRRSKPGGSNGGIIEVVEGGCCARIKKLRRVVRGESNGGVIEDVGGGGCASFKGKFLLKFMLLYSRKHCTSMQEGKCFPSRVF